MLVLWLVAASILTSLVLLGLGWLSYAGYAALEEPFGATTAMAAVGAGILLVAASIVLAFEVRHLRTVRRREKAEAVEAVSALVPQLLNTTQDAARAHPIGVMLTCAAAGFIAAAKPDIARTVVAAIAQGLDTHDGRPG